MSIFRKVRDFFRQPNLAVVLCTTLQSYGFDAQIMSPENTIGSIGLSKRHWVKRLPFYIGTVESGGSLGTIEISKCPIRWVNVLIFQGFDNGPVDHVYIFIIPDDRIRGISPIHVNTVGRKNFPGIGIVMSLKWESKVYDAGITERLNNLLSLNQTIVEGLNNGTGSDLEIDTENALGYWLLTVSKIPTSKLWESYQTIARELLASSIS